MNNKIIETLEFHKVRQKIEPYLLTEQGFEELRQLEPMVEVHRIQQAFNELTDIAQIFVENPISVWLLLVTSVQLCVVWS